MKSGNLNFLEPSGSLQACNGTALPLYTFIYIIIYNPLDQTLDEGLEIGIQGAKPHIKCDDALSHISADSKLISTNNAHKIKLFPRFNIQVHLNSAFTNQCENKNCQIQ